jgi:hypothetical protein
MAFLECEPLQLVLVEEAVVVIIEHLQPAEKLVQVVEAAAMLKAGLM